MGKSTKNNPYYQMNKQKKRGYLVGRLSMFLFRLLLEPSFTYRDSREIRSTSCGP